MSHNGHGGTPMTPESMSDGTMMHLSFYWGKDVIILFSGWPKDSLGMYLLALLFVFLIAVGIEILSVSPKAKLSNTPLVGAFIQASVYALRMAFAYMVMLSIMSYNLGIFIAAIAGHTIGFFLVKLRALYAADPTDHRAIDPKI